MTIEKCRVCPHECQVERLNLSPSSGFCGLPALPRICRADLHFGEEPCISGKKGSGTVFFSGCVLRCVFCQNHEISRASCGRAVDAEGLAKIFQKLQKKGAENINLVSPTPYAPVIIEALRMQPLNIPVIYNSGGYDSLETLRQLDGLIDIYLPDYKYHSNALAQKYSGVADYPQKAQIAVLEMLRQVGFPRYNENGLMEQGLMIRHLVLPNHTKESLLALHWISDFLPKGVAVSLMAQYFPPKGLKLPLELQRKLTKREYDKVVHAMLDLQLTDGFIQKRESATEEYVPTWDWKK